MPTLEEFLAQGQGGFKRPTLEGFLNQGMPQQPEERPGFFKRAGINALDRAGDIGNFLLPGDPLSFSTAAESLPEAEGFGEKAADFLGSAAPDVAIGAATFPFAAGAAAGLGVGRIASPFLRLLAQEAVHSATLAPIEFGTRPAGEAAMITATAPVAGALIGRGIGALGKAFGRGAGDVAEELTQDVVPQAARAEPEQLSLPGVQAVSRNIKSTFRQAVQRQLPPGALPPELDPHSDLIDAAERALFAPDAPTGSELNHLLTEGLHKAAGGKSPIMTLPAPLRKEAAKIISTVKGASHPADVIHSLYRDPYLGEAEIPITAAREHYRRLAAKALAKYADSDGMLTLYRGRTPKEQISPTISASLSKGQAGKFAGYHGTEILEQKVPLSDVLYYGDVPGGQNFYKLEKEVILPTTSLVDVPDEGIRSLSSSIQQEARNAFGLNPPGASRAVPLFRQMQLAAASRGGRSIRTSDLLDAGDPAVASAAKGAHNQLARLATKVAADSADEVTQTGLRLPPSINAEIVDAAESLPGEKGKEFLKKMVGKGSCPL